MWVLAGHSTRARSTSMRTEEGRRCPRAAVARARIPVEVSVRYDDVAAGRDLLALIEDLGDGPAVVMGNSMSAGGAVWAAVEAPAAVTGLVLIGPFVRDVPVGRVAELALRAALLRPWGPAAWSAYYRRLYPSVEPADLSQHRAAIRASLARPGAWRAFIATTRTSHAPAEARLAQVEAPALVVMGDADPDFPDPVAEAELVAGRLGGQVCIIPGAGHYPQAEQPEETSRRVAAFLDEVVPRA